MFSFPYRVQKEKEKEKKNRGTLGMKLFSYYKLCILFLSIVQLISKGNILVLCILQRKPYTIVYTTLLLQTHPLWLLLHLCLSTVVIVLVGLFENKQERDILFNPQKVNSECIQNLLFAFNGLIVSNADHLGTFSTFTAIAINMSVVIVLFYFTLKEDYKNIFILLSIPVLFYIGSALVALVSFLFISRQ